MEQVMQGIATQLVNNLAPMFISLMVIVVVFTLALARVRSRAIRELSGYAAMLVWLGWMASYYKAV